MTTDQLHVIFGTGPVGFATMQTLVDKGYPVRMVNRSGKTTNPLPEGVELRAGDAADPQFARRAAEGASVIYNALNPPYSRWLDLFPPLQASVAAAAEAQQARLIAMDNLYMYGDPKGQKISEDLPIAPHTRKGKLRAKMAQDLMDAHEAGQIQVVIARAADFFGPLVYGSALGGDLVFNRAIAGQAAQVLGDIDLPHSYSYIPDMGRALVTLAENDDALGQVWHLPTAPAISTRAVIEKICELLAQPPKVQVAPRFILRVMGLFNPDLREVIEMLYQFEGPFIIDDSKFVQRFGGEATPLDTALKTTVEWFQAHD